jgi:putative heme-binding domain-containing protein
VRALLPDADPEIRFECLRWIADAVLTEFQPEVEKWLSDPGLDYRLFEAALATWNTLRGEPGAGVTNPPVLLERIKDPATPARIKGFALRLLPVSQAQVTVELLKGFLAEGDAVLSQEAVRTLNGMAKPDSHAVLAGIVGDSQQSTTLRAEAIPGLAMSAQSEHVKLLVDLASGAEPTLRDEARRSLRFTDHDKSFVMESDRPSFADTSAWLKRLDALPGNADAEAGRRIFFHSKVALCSTCHRHGGRGTVLGPDLSLIAKQGDRAAILRSILEPHREVAPQFYPSQVKLKDGTEFIGILLRSSSSEVFRDLTGKEKSFPKTDVVQRTELKTSLMPPGLVAGLSSAELRDLLAFLTAGAQ